MADECKERALAFAIDNSAAADGSVDAQQWLVPLPSHHHHQPQQDDDAELRPGGDGDREAEQLGRSVLLALEARFLQGLIGEDEVMQVLASLLELDEPYRNGGFGAVPAPAAAVAGLEKRVHCGGKEGNYRTTGSCGAGGCVICMEEFEAGDELGVMLCSHRHCFHRSCIAEWLGQSNACPLCRHALTPAS